MLGSSRSGVPPKEYATLPARQSGSRRFGLAWPGRLARRAQPSTAVSLVRVPRARAMTFCPGCPETSSLAVRRTQFNDITRPVGREFLCRDPPPRGSFTRNPGALQCSAQPEPLDQRVRELPPDPRQLCSLAARGELLADAALPFDEQRCVRGRDTLQDREDPAHGHARAEQAAEGILLERSVSRSARG